MDDRVTIPTSMKKNILQILHSAHQGVSNMTARANQTVYWPDILKDIRNTRYTCKACSEVAPSQPQEPLQLSPSPDWPFQQICADYFELENHSYLSIVDRYIAWLNIYHFCPGHSTSKTLIDTFRTFFIAYGVPEELSSDGGPQFVSNSFKTFLLTWGIKHRLSSVDYPQSNRRAELGVKSA